MKLVIQRSPKASDDHIWSAVFDLISVHVRTTPSPRLFTFNLQTLKPQNTSSFANSSEFRKHIDTALKQELGDFHVDVPGVFEVLFGNIAGLDVTARVVLSKAQEGESPLYSEGRGWKDWPKDARERDVLKWLVRVIKKVVGLAEAHEPALRIHQRPLVQIIQPLDGSIASRKLDIGFVSDSIATEDSECSEILIPGGFKNDRKFDGPSNAWLDLGKYAREALAAQDSRRFTLGFTLCGPFLRLWVFDRVGGLASEGIDINKEGVRFISVILGFLHMNRKQLGFDPTIITQGTKRYIEIEKDGRKEHLVIEKVIGRSSRVAGRATTYWKVHREDQPDTPLLVKDSWQSPERDEEGLLLREVSEHGIVNVARYYHHETVHVDGRPDDIFCIRGELRIPTSNQKKVGLRVDDNRSRSRQTHDDVTHQDSSNTTARKRTSDHDSTSFAPPPGKRAN